MDQTKWSKRAAKSPTSEAPSVFAEATRDVPPGTVATESPPHSAHGVAVAIAPKNHDSPPQKNERRQKLWEESGRSAGLEMAEALGLLIFLGLAFISIPTLWAAVWILAALLWMVAIKLEKISSCLVRANRREEEFEKRRWAASAEREKSDAK